MSDRVWYFAYGSNMQPATSAGRRGITPSRALVARAPGWRLVLDKTPLVPVAASFANLRADATASTWGVAYEITTHDLPHDWIAMLRAIPTCGESAEAIAGRRLVDAGLAAMRRTKD